MVSRRVIFCCLLALSASLGVSALEREYDPLDIGEHAVAQTIDDTLFDATREREVPLRVYLPNQEAPAPVLIFSHGLGGSFENNPYLGNHWSSRGYLVVFIQHHGSDQAVWQEVRLSKRMAAMKRAANYKNAILRFDDVSFVLDQLALLNADPSEALYQRMNLNAIGMSGHSFGASTTQGVSGQVLPLGNTHTDGRIDAALAMSPNSPKYGSAATAFAGVTIPWLLMTGTEDVSPIGKGSVASRLAVYPALPAGDKYELLLHDANHMAFSETIWGNATWARNPNHHRAILAISTAFWDAYLLQDSRAQQWLQSEEARTVLEVADRWQWK